MPARERGTGNAHRRAVQLRGERRAEDSARDRDPFWSAFWGRFTPPPAA